MGAVTEPDRIATLDIVRGVAVMGILAMNIVAFAMPMQAYFNPFAYGEGTGDLVTWFINFVFVDGRMRGFFSFLFGASMLLVIDRAEAAGASPASIHYRRMAWLLVFGLIHLYLIWWGDILAHYALVGMVAYLFRRKSPRALIGWAVGLLVVQIAIMAVGAGFFFWAEAQATAPGASAKAIQTWQKASQDFAPLTGQALAADLALYRDGYAALVQYRLEKFAVAPLTQLPAFGWETLAYMLLGMAGLKSGFLTGAWERRRYARIALLTLATCLPIYALLGWLNYRSNFDTPALFAISFGATTPFRPFVIVGYAAFVILLTRGGGAFVDRIAAAGRTAFTNYLGTSLVMTLIFYGYGLGLYGHVSRPELYLFVLGMWALMLLWSKPWLDHFRYGPFEWLWRSLARWRLEPLSRTPRPVPAAEYKVVP